jgi:hypothetical protein
VSYPVQSPDESEGHEDEPQDAEHCEEICHGSSIRPPP